MPRYEIKVTLEVDEIGDDGLRRPFTRATSEHNGSYKTLAETQAQLEGAFRKMREMMLAEKCGGSR